MSSSLLLVAPYIRVLFRSGRLLKRSILPRIRSHALIPRCREIRGVHYTICYISSFSKISLSRPISRNPDPLGAEPRSRSERDCKDTKIILTPTTPRGKILSSSSQSRPVSRRLARPLPSFAFAKVRLLFQSGQIYFPPHELRIVAPLQIRNLQKISSCTERRKTPISGRIEPKLPLCKRSRIGRQALLVVLKSIAPQPAPIRMLKLFLQ